MEWYFRDISDDPSEKELTQQDQFNNDEVVLAEALVRETIQNSTDAQAAGDKPVQVHFALVDPTLPETRRFFDQLVAGLAPHLDKCGIPIPKVPQRFLTIEDFNTSGLRGSIDRKDEGQFCGFWRRFGRSNKKGTSGGRWGLGKLVFSSSSSIRTLIGLTRRNESPELCLMGQAILKNHSIDSVELDSVGFWCRMDVRKGLPSTDDAHCMEVARLAGLRRTTETGLSLIVPYVLPDIESKHLMSAVLKNYYFPVLTGRLVVTVDDTVISANTFDQVSSELGSDTVSQPLLSFIRHLQLLRRGDPILVLPPAWQTETITGELLGEVTLSKLRQRFAAGEMLYFRAPLSVKKKNESRQTHQGTFIDLFIQAAPPNERSQTLVVRNSITVSTEGKRAHLTGCFAALVADEERISQLLGDAENPAHTQWNERAEKLRANWLSPHLVVRRVRAVLQELHSVIADRIERDDPMALLDFFSIPRSKGSRHRQSGRTEEQKEYPIAKPRPFRIEHRNGGFALIPNPQVQPESFPMTIFLRCAYDVLNGNPFRRFSDNDFSFHNGRLRVQSQNALFWPTDANEARIDAKGPGFRIDVTGFDQNRDLVVEAET